MNKYRLNDNDYISILNYYNINNNNFKKKNIKNIAEDVLASKLCRCIVKVGNYYKKKQSFNKKQKYIAGICKRSVLTRKKLHINKYSCKQKPSFIKKTKQKYKLFKKNKTIRIVRKKY
jgi:hypothetical protein